jgi:hypothetical protein
MLTTAQVPNASDTLAGADGIVGTGWPLIIPPAAGVAVAILCGIALILLVALWGAPPRYRAAIIASLGGMFESIGRAIRSCWRNDADHSSDDEDHRLR